MNTLLRANALVLGSFVLAATASAAEYCGMQVTQAAQAIDAISYPEREIDSTAANFKKYSGMHTKLYSVSLKDKTGVTTNYTVQVGEYEAASTSCEIDSVVRN
jgi:hypothetical protein